MKPSERIHEIFMKHQQSKAAIDLQEYLQYQIAAVVEYLDEEYEKMSYGPLVCKHGHLQGVGCIECQRETCNPGSAFQ